MNTSSNFSFEACRREGGGCQTLYGSTNSDIDNWGSQREAQGDTVVYFSDKCRDLCNKANTSVTSIENGITGVFATGELPKATLTDASAIAVSVGGLSKLRLINPESKPRNTNQ